MDIVLPPYERAVKFAGSEAALARLMEITPWGLSKLNKERLPQKRCLQIEKVTAHLVKAEELRPDINWEYVRSLKQAEVAHV